LQNDAIKSFKAELIIIDKVNDLAIIKIMDLPKDLEPINYSFKAEGAIEVGESVFTIGFPLALSGMGKDPKFTDGKISSKRGYEGSINSFQTTIPVQPGNSGGPVYNDKGQLIGLINAKVANADNVSYAIKLNHMIALVDIMNNPIETPKQADISSLNTESKIKILSRYSVIIKVK
jgi:S1-C subfamily serine protease